MILISKEEVTHQSKNIMKMIDFTKEEAQQMDFQDMKNFNHLIIHNMHVYVFIIHNLLIVVIQIGKDGVIYVLKIINHHAELKKL